MTGMSKEVTADAQCSQRFGTRRLTDHLGLEVYGFDFQRDLDDEAVGEIRRLADEHFVILIRGQKLTEEQHVDFTARLGDPIFPTEGAFSSRNCPMILRIGNVDHDGKHLTADAPMTQYFVSAEKWHSDGSYKQDPNYLTMLHSVEIPPEGGNTGFASMVAAFAALPEEEKEMLRGKQMVHPYIHGNSKIKDWKGADLKPAVHPVVRTLPNGAEALYLSQYAGAHIVGMDQNESDALVQRLFDFVTQPQFSYTHEWQVSDTLIWNNRGVIHQARSYPPIYRRLLNRTETIRETEAVRQAMANA